MTAAGLPFAALKARRDAVRATLQAARQEAALEMLDVAVDAVAPTEQARQQNRGALLRFRMGR